MDTAYEEFFSQRIPVFFCFVFLLFLYRGFLLITDKMHAYQKDLVIPGPDVSGQHVQVRYYVLDSYYYSGHWGYLANIFQGRIEYELIYSLRGAKHRVNYSVHIR